MSIQLMMHDTIEIKRRGTGTTDSHGMPSGALSTVATVRGRMVEGGGKDIIDDQEVLVSSPVLRVPIGTDIKAFDQVTITDQDAVSLGTFKVSESHKAAGIKHHIRCKLERSK